MRSDIKVTDKTDDSGRVLREFEIAGMTARIVALDTTGERWHVEVGGGEAGVIEYHGNLEEATWEAVTRARELSEQSEAADYDRLPRLAGSKAGLEGA